MLKTDARTFLLLLCMGLTGCATGGVRSMGGARGYSIQYVSITPEPGETLAPGQLVTLTLTVRYRLEIAERGRIVAVLQRSDNSPLIPGREQASVQVAKGSGETTLTDTFEVPRDTRVVRLYVPLVPEGVNPTSGELLIDYPVR